MKTPLRTHRWSIPLSLALALVLAARASAVIISTGDGSGNLDPPPNDPGFYNVGATGAVSCVYLGSGWVLTTSHSHIGTTTFAGVPYEIVPNSGVQLQNPQGMGQTQFTDLVMYQIAGEPDLQRPRISAETPANNVEITMIGRGRNRAVNLTNWNAAWQEVAFPSTHLGYKAAPGQSIRWGTNKISDNVEVVTVTTASGNLQVNAIATRFDNDGTATAYEAQAIAGDSGGGGFYDNPLTGYRELSGLMFAIQPKAGQPIDTAVFTTLTYLADLSIYREQILDLNPIPGDINEDYFVDVFDVGIVSDNWLDPGGEGDVNNDGVVNIFDVGLLSDFWEPPPPGFEGAGAPVPEPPTAMLLVSAALLLFALRPTQRNP